MQNIFTNVLLKDLFLPEGFTKDVFLEKIILPEAAAWIIQNDSNLLLNHEDAHNILRASTDYGGFMFPSDGGDTEDSMIDQFVETRACRPDVVLNCTVENVWANFKVRPHSFEVTKDFYVATVEKAKEKNTCEEP